MIADTPDGPDELEPEDYFARARRVLEERRKSGVPMPAPPAIEAAPKPIPATTPIRHPRVDWMTAREREED